MTERTLGLKAVTGFRIRAQKRPRGSRSYRTGEFETTSVLYGVLDFSVSGFSSPS